LSLIEEDADEEFLTNNDGDSSFQRNGFGETRKMIITEDEEEEG